MDNEINLDEIKKIQLNILLEIHAFCVKHDIKYSLAYGTLLGAVRHQGYIPWDDDIDIYMPREDYNTFINSFRSDNYTLIHSLNNTLIPIGKVIDNRTIVKEKVNHSASLGIFVDIFPLDYLPNSSDEQKRLKKKSAFWFYMKAIRDMRFTKKRNSSKNILLLFLKLFSSPIPYRFILKNINKVMLETKENHSCGLYDYNVYKRDFCIPFEERDRLIELDFEGFKFFAFRNYDYILKANYGDYMTLPPAEKRVSNHNYKAYYKIKNQ